MVNNKDKASTEVTSAQDTRAVAEEPEMKDVIVKGKVKSPPNPTNKSEWPIKENKPSYKNRDSFHSIYFSKGKKKLREKNGVLAILPHKCSGISIATKVEDQDKGLSNKPKKAPSKLIQTAARHHASKLASLLQ